MRVKQVEHELFLNSRRQYENKVLLNSFNQTFVAEREYFTFYGFNLVGQSRDGVNEAFLGLLITQFM